MIWSVSWRNVWRNKVRSLIILTAIAIGIFAGVFSWAFYRGMLVQRIENAIKTEASHIQLHHKKYLQDPDVKYFIPDVVPKAAEIQELESVKATSPRTLLNSMILSAETGSGVRIMGVDPEKEKQVTDLYTHIVEGKYFEGVKRNPIVIGQKLAEKLDVKLHSKVVLTMQQMDGTITRSQFRIAGIYKTPNSAYDGTNVFVKQSDLKPLIALAENAGHEIAVLLKNNDSLKESLAQIQQKYPDADVKTWREIMPDVSVVEETGDVSMYFFIIIILLALLFGIINTMLMAVLERTKELGMLMAVGMNRLRVFFMILLETVYLSLFGGLVGIIFAYILTFIAHKQGIDISQFSSAFSSMGYSSIVYPALEIGIAIKVTIMVFFTGIIGAIYPAIKALRMKPAEALRIDM